MAKGKGDARGSGWRKSVSQEYYYGKLALWFAIGFGVGAVFMLWVTA